MLTEKQKKSLKIRVVIEGLAFDDYKTSLVDGKTIYRKQMLPENKKCRVQMIKKHKVALNGKDGEKHIQTDCITTLIKRFLAQQSHRTCFSNFYLFIYLFVCFIVFLFIYLFTYLIIHLFIFYSWHIKQLSVINSN